jgi:hypothetical protein
VADSIANAALYFGAVQSLAGEAEPPDQRLPFSVAKTNFYTAARQGLHAKIEWLDDRRATLGQVMADDLLPRARQGLLQLGIDASEADLWLGIVESRVRTGRTGSAWQRTWVRRNGPDMATLTAAYLERQQTGRPVHEWTV